MQAAATPKPAPSSSAKPKPPPPTTPAKLSYKEKRELTEVEARIEQAEARKAEIEAALHANPSDFEAVAALSQELGDLTTTLDRDVERWAELAERA